MQRLVLAGWTVQTAACHVFPAIAGPLAGSLWDAADTAARSHGGVPAASADVGRMGAPPPRVFRGGRAAPAPLHPFHAG